MLPPMPNRIGPAVQPDHPSTASNTTEENIEAARREEALQRVMEDLESILKNSARNFEVCFLHG
jgi:hypothetical protein